MSEVSGVVQSISSRDTNAGKMWDIVVGGQKYGAGKFRPKAEEGQYVTFGVVNNGNFKNIERGSLKVSDKKPSYEEKTSGSTSSYPSKAVNSFDARQDAISRQAASNTAIEWVKFLHEAGAVAVPASKKGQAQAVLDTIRLEYEKKFYERNTGNEWKDISPTKVDAEDSNIEDTEDESEPWE